MNPVADIMFIQLDDQMDSKTLLGTYVCREVPGEFEWQPGALTQVELFGTGETDIVLRVSQLVGH